MAANDLFKHTSDLRIYVPDINLATPIADFEYSFRAPESKLINLIGQATYDQLKDHYNGDNNDPILIKGIKFLQGSLGNLAGHGIFVMDAAERNENKKMYRYQEDQHLRIYLNNANAELGQLLTHLDANTTKYTSWSETTLYKTRIEQIIKTYTEFGKYYYIDESAYFFSKLPFLMKEITADTLNPIIEDFKGLDATEDAAIIEKVKQCLAYLTIAMALRRFDFIDLPKTIRNNVTGSLSKTIRTGYGEAKAMEQVSSEIELKGISYLQALDRMMEKKTTGTLEVPDEIHEDDDQFYLQT